MLNSMVCKVKSKLTLSVILVSSSKTRFVIGILCTSSGLPIFTKPDIWNMDKLDVDNTWCSSKTCAASM